MHTLYGSQGSGSAAVEAALVVAGLPYNVERASTWEADSAQAALALRNPLGQIPTLVLPDGSVMTESAAILANLGLAHPASGLLPADPTGLGQALRGMVFIAANCYAAISIIDYPERWLPDADDALRKRLQSGTGRRLRAMWSAFADQFPAERFGAGAAPDALDLLASVVSRWGGTRQHLQAERPSLAQALAAIDDHPAVAAVFSRHWPRSA